MIDAGDVDIWLLVYVTLLRIGELGLSRRNTARLLARGAFEVAPRHYMALVALHTTWLGTLWLHVLDVIPLLGTAEAASLSVGWLLIFLVLQVARFWTIASLGERWTTRIIVLPDAPLVRRGPYRYMAHPNYIVVAGEIAVLPLVFGAVWLALVFSALNAAALYVRIRAENTALHRMRRHDEERHR